MSYLSLLFLCVSICLFYLFHLPRIKMCTRGTYIGYSASAGRGSPEYIIYGTVTALRDKTDIPVNSPVSMELIRLQNALTQSVRG